MYSSKESVNILTSLLLAHGVRHAVVCPGSRNAPIVHNLNECELIECHPVTDERSAGFQAIGLSQAEGYQPVVVCVTSGSALLNLYPAVAEAYYQQVPIIVVSADRPAQWIGQLDGQTLPQPDALGRMVRKAVSLPEVYEGEQHDEMHWYCNRLVNEALLTSMGRVKGPVHINVPISEPFYAFGVETLPEERKIEAFHSADINGLDGAPGQLFGQCKRPLMVVGQLNNAYSLMHHLCWAALDYPMLWESLAMPSYTYPLDDDELAQWDCAQVLGAFDSLIDKIKDDERFRPDLVVYLGGHIVSKKLKDYLRSLEDVPQIRVSQDGIAEDTFSHLTAVFDAPVPSFLDFMGEMYEEDWEEFQKLWTDALRECLCDKLAYSPEYSSLAVVKEFWSKIQEKEPVKRAELNADGAFDPIRGYAAFDPNITCGIFSGNSSAIRLMNIYADRHVYCNRGVNGIEGSLSTAVGFSLCAKSEKNVYCVLGDLSFFYDQNALWNQNLNGKLRIIVLNNGGGAIFGKFEGLRQSEAREKLVMAKHHASAEGICRQNEVVYLSAHDMEEMKQGVDRIINEESDRPMLLEVFTDIDADNDAYQQISQHSTFNT